MKKQLTTLKCIALAAIALTTVSCEDSDDNGNIIDNNNSISDIVDDNPTFTILDNALERTGLDQTLDQAGGTFTVFAPTDTAFQTFLSANGFATIDDVPVVLLRNTLRNHVLSTVAMSTDLSDGYVKTNATNENNDFLDLYIDLDGGVFLNGDAEVTTADVNADNGVIHIVDEVIALPTVATLAAANPNFDNLVTALTQENLVSTVADPAATLTVFAPLNSSFQSLIDADPNDSLTDINAILGLANLSDILTYHVVSGAAVRAEDITDGLIVDPLGPGTFTINTTNGVVITDANSRTVEVIVTNVTAINGVVHAIDNVLLP
ncbi:fasciclin domain-containing protein [Nonlabens sp.]|uniref:fasciclin domain-containing protein n=1 Tax=Nonlabens sp. TaxID=1888209 RepID=UPI003F6A046F